MALVNELKSENEQIKDLVDKIDSKKVDNYKWDDDYFKIPE